LGFTSVLWLFLAREIWVATSSVQPTLKWAIRLGGLCVLSITATTVLQVAFWPSCDLHHFFLLILPAVVLTDSGAYFFGRLLGGPRFLPAISPQKTWSGFLGGVSLGTLWCIGLCVWSDQMSFPNVLISVLIPLASVAGDLLESWTKRRLNIKDFSNLLPGHGGLWDRLDGLMGVLFALGLLSLSTQAITFARNQS
jgi:CDP-diglyceride synthetase